MSALSGMKIKADKYEVLAKLRVNRDAHAGIVQEAKAGYGAKAVAMLKEKLSAFEIGKGELLCLILQAPVDNTKQYDQIITMLEFSQDSQVELTAEQVRNFIMDDWDWKQQFLTSNAQYSKMAADTVGATM